MANLKTIQFLRNATLYGSLEAAKTALTAKAATLLDGSPVIGRYTSGSETRSILGIVYNGTLSFFMNEKEIDNVLEGLDYSGITTSDAAVVTNVTEADGVVSASSENVGNLALTDYVKGSDSGSVAATDSINEAVAKLENQIDAEKDARAAAIDALDYTGYTLGDSEVFATITEENGVIAATGKNLSGIKLAGYAEGTDADIAATDTLGEALGKLQAQINAMDKDADVVAGQVVTTVTEADGKVTETKANVKDLQLGGYAKTNDTGNILSADTINVALSKLENKAAAITIDNVDGSINVTTAATGTDINVNIKSGEKVIMLDGEGNGIYTDIKLSGITPSSTNVREEYALIASDGLTQLGSSIKVYKDSSLTNIYIGHVDDVLTNADSSGESNDTAVTNGTGDTALVYIMHLENDKYKLAAVNVQAFLEETEFGSGVTATNHVVHGVVDPNSESFFTVGADGFKVAGISGFVQSSIEDLDVAVINPGIGKYIYAIEENNGKIAASGANVSDAVLNGYSKGSDSTAVAPTDDVKGAISKLENQIDKAKAAATTKVVEGTDNEHLTIASATSTDESVTYTVTLTDVASDSALTAEITARKAVDGQTGQTYAANTSANYISSATDLNDADVKLDAALKASDDNIAQLRTDVNALSGKAVTEINSSDSSISAVSSLTTDGTVKYNIVTDGGKIKATGFNASASSGTPSASDSVSTVLSKLYANAKMDAVKAGSATTVVAAADGTTVDVKLDDSSELSVNNNDGNGNNALIITSDGLFLSKDWDCGTFN